MDEPVKTGPGRRQRKAQATRRRVLDAAETLFIRDGYATTTMAVIAEEADVAVQTVYAAFGTKRAILTELFAVRVVGDDEGTPLRDRRDWQDMEREVDPRRQLALLASIATRIGGRIAALYGVMAGAALTPRSRKRTASSSKPATETNVVSHGPCHAGVPCEPDCPRPVRPTSCGPSPTPTPTAASSVNEGGRLRSTSFGWRRYSSPPFSSSRHATEATDGNLRGS